MTREEKSFVVECYCTSIYHTCSRCPLDKYVSDAENCFTLDSVYPCNIDRNYEILFGENSK